MYLKYPSVPNKFAMTAYTRMSNEDANGKLKKALLTTILLKMTKGRYSAPDAKLMATDNRNVRPKPVPARIRRV